MIALCLCAQGQTPPSKAAPSNEAKGMVPRGGPADYQAQAKAGKVTIGAEFMRHGIPTPQGPLTTEDYVVVEAGLFGGPGERTTLSINDFSLRINGKKTPLQSQPYGTVLSSVKDPEWEPPEPPSTKKSGGLSTGGGGGQGDPPPSPPKMPIAEQHAMQLKVQKGALPEGDRALPQAGLLFFSYRGKSQSIHSVELIYDGPAGKATLDLQP
jgi:hypothetical protein